MDVESKHRAAYDATQLLLLPILYAFCIASSVNSDTEVALADVWSQFWKATLFVKVRLAMFVSKCIR
uniref:Uncharacterized protein n=1 Tax=Romanomermis culicivorax TaxID=13658 RepID=A0A915K3S2_ROMCU